MRMTNALVTCCGVVFKYEKIFGRFTTSQMNVPFQGENQTLPLRIGSMFDTVLPEKKGYRA